MKIMLTLVALWFGLNLCSTSAQVVQDPLHDYYNRNFGKIDSAAAADPESSSPQVTPQTQVYSFQVDFTGKGQNAIFITDDECKLGSHGDYSWSIYFPLESGGYRLIAREIDAGIGGPGYIGYIDKIERYGIIRGGKYGITAYYLDNNTLKSQAIDQERGHDNAAHYPKYFSAHAPDYHIITYTLAQLEQKYAHPDPNNVITPAGK